MFADLRKTWLEVILSKSWSSDLIAALTVTAVALPLNLALAVACNVPPITGIVAGAIGGTVAALFGGARFLVSGPAAALSTLVLAVADKFGLVGVAASALFTGLVSLALAGLGLGRLIARVPESVVAGFATGVGIKIFDSQIPELLGFNYRVVEIVQMMHKPAWLHHVSWLSAMSGLGVAFLVITTTKYKRFPAALVGIAVVTFVAAYLRWDIERVGALPSQFPPFTLPILADEQWIDFIVLALPIALLAPVESLLASRTLDSMTPRNPPHNPTLELFGQGIANCTVGLFSGMPVTGVVVRSTVNVQSGAKTKVSAFAHGIFLAVAIIYLRNIIEQVPLSALAGLLCVIGFRLIDIHTFKELTQHHRLEALAFAITAFGTVTGHLVSGLAAGLALSMAHRWLVRHETATRIDIKRDAQRGIRAVLPRAMRLGGTLEAHDVSVSARPWLTHLRERSVIPSSAFVHQNANVIGKVIIGDRVHIAAGTSVRADEGSPFHIGSDTNIQDGVVMHALRDKHVHVGNDAWAIYVGHNVSLAHDALVHGPCYIGDNTFVGFKAVVHDAIVGANCYIGIGAVVVGVEIPDGRLVPHGRIVDTADAVDGLPMVDESHKAFNHDVVEVNQGLAKAYHAVAKSAREPIAPALASSGSTSSAWDIGWSRFQGERF